MPIEHVTASGDARLRDYIDLTDVALRTSFEAEHGLYIAESEKVILRALRAGYEPRSILMSDRWLERMTGLIEEVAQRSFRIRQCLSLKNLNLKKSLASMFIEVLLHR